MTFDTSSKNRLSPRIVSGNTLAKELFMLISERLGMVHSLIQKSGRWCAYWAPSGFPLAAVTIATLKIEAGALKAAALAPLHYSSHPS